MSNENTPSTADSRPAVGGPVERQVRAPHPEREAFEAWMRKHNPGADPDVIWRDAQFPDCYHYGATEAAWQAWQAARPKRADVGRLVNLAATLISADTLRKLWRLEEESGRTLGRRALSAALADADENLKIAAIDLAAVARAL